MSGFARVVVVFLALVALAVGFVGGTVALDTFRPANSNVTTVVNFEVQSGDTADSVAQRLQADGLIRNSLIFTRLARLKKLNSLTPGIYHFSPDMSAYHILSRLLSGQPDVAKKTEVFVNFADGLRATQYPAYLTALSNFSAKDFLTIAKTGIEPDGTKLWTKYWFIMPPVAGKTAYALEGYLDPTAQDFFLNATTTQVVEKLLTQFGIDLCPGPASNPAQYSSDAKQCRAHAVTVGGKNIFDLMRAAYPDAKSDVVALNDTLVIASFTTREIRKSSDFAGVASVYHNRYLHSIGLLVGDVGLTFGSDPSVEYARDTLTSPANGKWWADLNGDGHKIAPTSPYNTYNQNGMPPGPIANIYITEIKLAATPAKSANLYFVSDKCGKIWYATNSYDFNNTLLPKMS
ncbi:MAG: endolytic transglycosylase MltG, partial [Chloroflexota bacterium]|nr:endolytic transglycosylase MltG [Chloroflexota bacterium]